MRKVKQRLSLRLSLVVLACAAMLPRASEAGETSALAWEMLNPPTLRLFWVDRNSDLRVRLRNVGTQVWSEKAGDHLSYHWLDPSGEVIEQDGLRTVFPHPVAPGETIEVVARVNAPSQTGRWLFEWDMVREQVAWYGPPAAGGPLRFPVWVLRRCSLLQVGFLILTVGAVLVSRRSRSSPESRWWIAVDAGPVVWAWLGALLVTVTFSELADVQLWRGGGILSASAAALLALPVAMLPRRWRTWVAAIVVVLVTVVAFADLLYLRFFGNVVPLVAVSAVGQLGRIEGSITALMRSPDVWLIPAVAGAVVLALLWPRRPKQKGAGRWRAVAPGAIATLVCALAGVPTVTTLARGLADPATAEQMFSKAFLLGQWGFVNVHFFDALRTWREWVGLEALDPAMAARVRSFFARHSAAEARAAADHGVASGANLILIQVESLQQWVVGARVNGVEITPFLNTLSRRALYFPWVFDETGQGRSSDGEFECLNSQHALDRGAVAFRRTHNHFVALPEVLREHGYSTLSAHPFEKSFWNRGVLHPRWGFEHMLFKDELGPGETIGWGLADGVFFSRMAQQLSLRRPPYFAFLITLGLHHPFDEFPDRHKVLDVGELRGTPLGNYIHAMHYFDASLAEFIDELTRGGMLGNTVVALYGDHEAGLSVDDHLLKIIGQANWEPSVLVRLQRVPLFILLPGQKLSGEVPVVGGQVDIAPTLLALLGITPPRVFVGHHLDPAHPSLAVLNDGSVVGRDRMYVATGPAIPPDGACFAWPGGAPLPRADCWDLRREGQDELEASRFVVLHDMARQIMADSKPEPVR